jgi:hypothetical protein
MLAGAEVQKPAAAPAASEADTAATTPAPPPPPAEEPEAPSHGRQPSIKFPPRRTSDGVRISSLPAGEAKECVYLPPMPGCVGNGSKLTIGRHDAQFPVARLESSARVS